MSIKDKIEKLPDDAIISHIEYDHYAGGGYIDCSHADLKALSASHTALLEAAREAEHQLSFVLHRIGLDQAVLSEISAQFAEAQAEHARQGLENAISEAEKL